MKHFLKLTALLAALVLLTACAAGQDAQEDSVGEAVTGADWRTYGWVNDTGTLTLDGVSTEVLACVFDDSVMFYLDDDTQTVAAVAEYPQKMDGAHDRFESLRFDDLDGDGNSDVLLVLSSPDGAQQELVWTWDTQSASFSYRSDEKN